MFIIVFEERELCCPHNLLSYYGLALLRFYTGTSHLSVLVFTFLLYFIVQKLTEAVLLNISRYLSDYYVIVLTNVTILTCRYGLQASTLNFYFPTLSSNFLY